MVMGSVYGLRRNEVIIQFWYFTESESENTIFWESTAVSFRDFSLVFGMFESDLMAWPFSRYLRKYYYIAPPRKIIGFFFRF